MTSVLLHILVPLLGIPFPLCPSLRSSTYSSRPSARRLPHMWTFPTYKMPPGDSAQASPFTTTIVLVWLFKYYVGQDCCPISCNEQEATQQGFFGP